MYLPVEIGQKALRSHFAAAAALASPLAADARSLNAAPHHELAEHSDLLPAADGRARSYFYKSLKVTQPNKVFIIRGNTDLVVSRL